MKIHCTILRGLVLLLALALLLPPGAGLAEPNTSYYLITPANAQLTHNGLNADGTPFVGRYGDDDSYYYLKPDKTADGAPFAVEYHCDSLPAGTYSLSVGYKSRPEGAQTVTLACDGVTAYTFSTVSSSVQEHNDAAPDLVVAQDGPHLFTWTVTGGSSNNLTLGNLTLIRQETVEITVSCDEAMGKVSGGGNFRTGDMAVLTATPNPGYHFVKWIGDELGNAVSYYPVYAFSVTGGMDAVAVFSPYFYRTSEESAVTRDGNRSFTVSTDSGVQGKYTNFQGTQVGDWASYTIQVPAAGDYDITYKYRAQSASPIVQQYVNGTAAGAPYDLYPGKQGYFIVHSMGTFHLEAGETVIRMEVTGKNSAVSGDNARKYTISLQAFTLTPVTEPAPKRALSRTVKIACVGDSITEGAGSGDKTVYSYPARLQEMLGPDYEVGNFGVAGSTLMNMYSEGYTKTQRYRDSLAFGADIVIIMLGTNDCKYFSGHAADYERQYNDLIAQYRGTDPEKEPKIYLATSCYNSRPAGKINEGVIHNEIVPLQRKIAQDNGLEVIDVHAAMEGRYSLMNDGIHPTDEGYLYLAGVFYETVKHYLPEDVTLLYDPDAPTLTGLEAVFRAEAYPADHVFSPEDVTVTGIYSDGSTAPITEGITLEGTLDGDIWQVTVTVGERSITLTVPLLPAFRPGDLNDDGDLTVADVVLLRRAILQNGAPADYPAGDMNTDSALTVADVVLLRRTILEQ